MSSPRGKSLHWPGCPARPVPPSPLLACLPSLFALPSCALPWLLVGLLCSLLTGGAAALTVAGLLLACAACLLSLPACLLVVCLVVCLVLLSFVPLWFSSVVPVVVCRRGWGPSVGTVHGLRLARGPRRFPLFPRPEMVDARRRYAWWRSARPSDDAAGGRPVSPACGWPFRLASRRRHAAAAERRVEGR